MSWQDIAAIGFLLTIPVSAATAYLRIYIAKETTASENRLMLKLRHEFVPAAEVRLLFTAIERRVGTAEDNIRHLQDA